MELILFKEAKNMLENTATSTNGTRKTKYPHIEIIIVTD
jgi:hypothetical protein